MFLEHVQRQGRVYCGALGSVSIAVWDETPTIEQARMVVTGLGRMSRSHNEFALLAVLGRNCSIPDGPIRELIVDEMRRASSQIRALANVIESDGFGAAAVRAVVTGMALMLRPAHQVKTFISVQEASGFLQSFLPRTASATVLSDALVELRAR